MTCTWGANTCITKEGLVHLSVDQLFTTLCWKFDYILLDINKISLGRLRTLQDVFPGAEAIGSRMFHASQAGCAGGITNGWILRICQRQGSISVLWGVEGGSCDRSGTCCEQHTDSLTDTGKLCYRNVGCHHTRTVLSAWMNELIH